MNYDQNLRNLRNQICSDWTRDDTKFIQIDSSLWRMCQKTLKEDAISKDKELGFVELGPHLSSALSKSTYEDLGALAEGSVCSFFPIISVEQIASLMGIAANGFAFPILPSSLCVQLLGCGTRYGFAISKRMPELFRYRGRHRQPAGNGYTEQYHRLLSRQSAHPQL